MWLQLADFVLVVHAAFVAFVVGGLVVIWLGYFRGWRFVRNFWWRLAHVLAMGCVAAESVLGVPCPLTIWEDKLRLRAGSDAGYSGSFLQHWIHSVMFFQASEAVFTMAYVTFFLLLLLSFWIVRPRGPGWRSLP